MQGEILSWSLMGVKALREMERVNFNEGKILLYTILGLKYSFSDQII